MLKNVTNILYLESDICVYIICTYARHTECIMTKYIGLKRPIVYGPPSGPLFHNILL